IGVNYVCSKRAWLGGVQKIGPINNGKYPIDDNVINNIIDCGSARYLFGSSAYLPDDRGSLTLGGRMFDNKLDLGTVIRYNKGHQDRSVFNKYGIANVAYVAD
ncbi:TPA: TonB-dependent receptor, partial [Yersinia enterocolitica]|nr:TonB-dependent receptor [Yersinia enterocolitica]